MKVSIQLINTLIYRNLKYLLKSREFKNNRNINPPFRDVQASLEEISCQPAYFRPEQLERVTSCGFGRSLDSEVEWLRARSWRESSTQQCELRNVVVIGGRIFTEDSFFLLSRRLPYWSLLNPAPSFSKACIANSMQGLHYFGHWLRDDCSAFEIGKGLGSDLISLCRPKWSDSKFYEQSFQQSWNEVSFFKCENLTMLRDIGFNSDKRSRLASLRNRIRIGRRSSGGIFYIKRGKSATARNIENESELTRGLERKGIRVLEAEDNICEMYDQCLDADAIITVEGSQAAHALFLLKEGGSIIIIQPPDRFYNPHLAWARMFDMSYGVVVGEGGINGTRVHEAEIMEALEGVL